MEFGPMASYYAPGTIIPSKLHLYQAETSKRDVLPFLSLPAEIRNRIYDRLFEPCLVEVTSGREPRLPDKLPNLPSAELPKSWHKTEDRANLGKQPMRVVQKDDVQLREATEAPKSSFPKRRKHWRVKKAGLRMQSQVVRFVGSIRHRRSVHHHIPFNFLFCNRQIYDEALGVVYNRITFRFTENDVMDRFLLVTPARALQAIHALDISHETHEEPELTAHRNKKVAADKKWRKTCKVIQVKLISLKILRLQLHLNDWPSQLQLNEGWARAILQLRGASGLDRVDAELSHFGFGEERLRTVAQALEDALMTSEGRVAKTKQRRPQPQKKRTRPPRVLVIKMT